MSSKSDIAVSVRGLSKSYTIAHQGEKHSTLAETLLAKARNPFQRTPKETFWALKDVNFDIKKGEVVGIIGRNGAGKSTLLKILSRITEPTAGQIDLYGRVGSLLEVGTGFHPELTGRENIFLNGAILGMTKAEIRKQFDAIVDFAGVEKFLDTPVKRYSSGMYVRLAFAVAAHLKCEILVVDEVLAVGDAVFQEKCLRKMGDVGRSGRTVFFVSHSPASIKRLCGSGLFMRNGQCISHTSVDDALQLYLENGTQNLLEMDRGALRRLVVEQLGKEIEIRADFEQDWTIPVPGLGFVISTNEGMPICGTNPMRAGIRATKTALKAGTVIARITTPVLLEGRYTLSVWFGDGTVDFVHYPNCVSFEIHGMADSRPGQQIHDGPVVPQCTWQFLDERGVSI